MGLSNHYIAKFKLKHLIPLSILAVTIFVMVVFGYFYFKDVQASINSATKLYLTEMSRQSSQNVRDRISKDFSLLHSISGLVGKENDMNVEDLMPILAKEVKRNSFKRMGVIFPDGTYFSTDNAKFSPTKDAFFNQAFSGKSVVTDTFRDQAGNKKINVYAVPIYQNKKIEAILFATIDNAEYSKILSLSTFGGKGYSYIVKKNGSIIISSGQEFKGAKVKNIFDVSTLISKSDLSQLKSDFSSQKTNMIQYKNKGSLRYLTYTPLKINDWYIVSSVPSSVVKKEYEKIIRTTLYTSIAIIVLFITLFVYIIILQNRYSKNLENLIFIDDVTGGKTWNYFKKKASDIVLANPNSNFAFVSFDIDKFRIINDAFGWEHGNRILAHISQVLDGMAHENEVAARVTNDNFVVLMNYEKESDIVKRLALFTKRVMLWPAKEEVPCQYTFSSGIYKFSGKRTDFDIMHNRANFTKNIVKHNPDLQYDFYDDEIRQTIVRQTELELEMNKALRLNQFSIYFQPKYDLKHTSVVGAEALVRWIHPEKGLIPPNDFIPLFERNGYIAKLDLFVFESVCKKVRQWIDEDKKPITISVNISRVNFHNPNLADILYKIASKYQIPVGFIEIEITESAVFENIHNLIKTIRDLRLMGFPVAIDDFGTGYSSLNLLKDLEVDVLKLDREFFNFAKDVERSQKVVANMISMAKDLNIKTVSEGVETLEHVEFLREVGCDIAQGYFFAKPMPTADFEKLLSEQINSCVEG